jgi:hypothetical protein
MNTTDLENMPETPSQPAQITRRSFVKRTTATIIVSSLALHAFRAEANPAHEQGAYYVEMINFPSFAEDTTIGKTFMSLSSGEKPLTHEGVDYKLVAKIELIPGSASRPYLKQHWQVQFTSCAILLKYDSISLPLGWKEFARVSAMPLSINEWVADDHQLGHNHSPKPFPSGQAGNGANSFKRSDEARGIIGGSIGTLTIEGEANDDDTGVKNVIATFQGIGSTVSTSTDPGIDASCGFKVTFQ